MCISMPLRDEQFSIAKNKPGADFNGAHSAGRLTAETPRRREERINWDTQ
jgi:hypothetical protein